MNPILVAGTGSWGNDGRVDWYCPQSPFDQFLTAKNLAPMFDHEGTIRLPFVWSTALSGVPFLTAKNHREWAAAGAALAYFVEDRADKRGAETAVIAHSHGLQVVLYACALHGLKIATLISCGSPVREDMMDTAQVARQNIGRWLHIHSDKTDRWQWFGEMFDGHFGIVREHPLANTNDSVPGVGHSELLRDVNQFHFWEDRQWLTWLR